MPASKLAWQISMSSSCTKQPIIHRSHTSSAMKPLSWVFAPRRRYRYNFLRRNKQRLKRQSFLSARQEVSQKARAIMRQRIIAHRNQEWPHFCHPFSKWHLGINQAPQDHAQGPEVRAMIVSRVDSVWAKPVRNSPALVPEELH